MDGFLDGIFKKVEELGRGPATQDARREVVETRNLAT